MGRKRPHEFVHAPWWIDSDICIPRGWDGFAHAGIEPPGFLVKTAISSLHARLPALTTAMRAALTTAMRAAIILAFGAHRA